jgi:aerobic-type carbon monoxide dehydrogenase small subunit (CoxS/CutS family)
LIQPVGSAGLRTDQLKQLVELREFSLRVHFLLDLRGRSALQTFEGLAGADVLDRVVQLFLQFQHFVCDFNVVAALGTLLFL